MTGISVGDYRDPERGLELGELLVAAARVPGVERVRLSSVEVIHVRDSLLAALREEPKVCPHLHVPLQSGDDGVLAAMGRHYTAERVPGGDPRRCVPRCRECNVTTDVIVGFPNEDEAAFDEHPRAGRERRASAGCTRSPTRRAPAPPRRSSATASRRRRRSAARASCAASRRCARAITAPRKLGGRERVLVDKVAADAVLGVHRRLHALLPARRRRERRRGDRRRRCASCTPTVCVSRPCDLAPAWLS